MCFENIFYVPEFVDRLLELLTEINISDYFSQSEVTSRNHSKWFPLFLKNLLSCLIVK